MLIFCNIGCTCCIHGPIIEITICSQRNRRLTKIVGSTNPHCAYKSFGISIIDGSNISGILPGKRSPFKPEVLTLLICTKRCIYIRRPFFGIDCNGGICISYEALISPKSEPKIAVITFIVTFDKYNIDKSGIAFCIKAGWWCRYDFEFCNIVGIDT